MLEMQLLRLFHGCGRSLVHMLLCILGKRSGKAFVGATMVPVTCIRGSLASVVSARAAGSLPLPRCCFQGSSKSSGSCFACSEQRCVEPTSDAVSHGNVHGDTSRAGKHWCALLHEKQPAASAVLGATGLSVWS